MMLKNQTVAAIVICGLTLSASASAQSTEEGGTSAMRALDAGSTVGIVTDEAGSTSMRLASELAALNGTGVRIVPIAGRGPLQNLSDLLNLKGVDAAIVQSDVLDYARDNNLHADIDKRVRFIARLHNREFHLIARSGQQGIASLKGQRVNIGLPGSGTALMAAAVFKDAGVNIVPTGYSHADALHLLKTGQIDAMVHIGGKPVPFLQHLDPADGLALLPVPFGPTLQHHYRPAQFEPRDYRGLMATGKTIETVSVGTAIVAYNWPRRSRGHDRLQKFAGALFGNIGTLQIKPRHDKWQTINLAAALPGWKRHKAAEKILAQSSGTGSGGDTQIEKLRASFKAILHALPTVHAAGQ